MVIGVPKEIKVLERRVAITPAGVHLLVAHGHKVLIEKGAGEGAGINDEEYEREGATIVPSADQVWEADLIMKVKEPIEPEYKYFREGLVIYAYFHLAAEPKLTEELLRRKVVSIAYETIQLPNGSLPLLRPMSEIAGKLATQVGAWALQHFNGGRGKLLGGAIGVPPSDVVIIGAGISGSNAARIAVGMGARVTVLDINIDKLERLYNDLNGSITTMYSTPYAVADLLRYADLVVGAVLVPGARAPIVATEEMVRNMKPGAVIVDISIDQGGCFETSRPTTHKDPIYVKHGVVHYCVTNMPGAVPRTSTFALTNVTIKYAIDIANKGWEKAAKEDHALALGVNTAYGYITHKAVAEAFPNLPYQELKL